MTLQFTDPTYPNRYWPARGNPRHYDGLDRGCAEAFWSVIAYCPSEPIAQKSLGTLPTAKTRVKLFSLNKLLQRLIP